MESARKLKKNILTDYFETSAKNPAFNLIVSLPLLIIYNMGIIASGWKNLNGVDYLTPLITKYLGSIGFFWFNIGVLVIFLALYYFLKSKNKEINLRAGVFILFESTIYAVFMGIFIPILTSGILPFNTGGKIYDSYSFFEKIAAASGAGFWEELVFRMILISLFYTVLTKVFRVKRGVSVFVSVMLASLIFSLVHFLNPDESFSLFALIYRTFAGLYFSLLFFFRGFSVAAYTHTIYDIIVFFGLL